MRHIIPISGKDSCATALVQVARQPDLPYELLFTDVGSELPETYAWLETVERRVGRPITRVGENLETLIRKEGILPAPKLRYCTRKGKIKPMEDFIGGDEAVVYFGIRADEDSHRGYQDTGRHRIIPSYPLRELGIGLAGVYLILEKQKIAPPGSLFFWKRLYDTVVERFDHSNRGGLWKRQPAADLLATYPRHIFDTLFSWRSRSNCYFCFFQAMYEWVGLLEHHPELFDKAERIEQSVVAGETERDENWHWRPDGSLDNIRRKKDRIFLKRVAFVLKAMRSRKLTLYESELAASSCGLFCGK